jgi:hypothetical protein
VAVARALGVDVVYAACIAAMVADVERWQLGSLGTGTTHVSLTVGGNDAGFVPVLVAAAAPAWLGDSKAVLDAGLRVVREELPGRLDRLLAEVGRRAPRARVVVTDYPVLLRGEDCNLATFFSPGEIRRLADAVVELSDVVQAAAERAGAGFVGVRPEFAGHEVCAPQEWLNGVAWPVEGSYHPNRRGQAAYGREVAEAFGVEAFGVDEFGVEATAPAGRRRRPEVIPGPPVRGSAPTFRLPDLLSEASLRGAAAHGLDPGEVRRLALAVQTPGVSAAGAREAWAGLHALDAEVRERLGRD